MNLHLLSAVSGGLRFHLDNIIYRREIGMDANGRLKPRSPVLVAHALMIACGIAMLPPLINKQWDLLLYASGGLVILMSLAAYPLAYYRAFKSFHRERVSGTLEQIYLTSLRPQEIFDGKFYGTLAPFFETRRYLLSFCALALLALYKLWFFEWLPLAAGGALMLVNHFGFSIYRGILGGLRTGAQRTRFFQAILEDTEFNVYLNHLGILATGRTLWRLFWGFSLAIYQWLDRRIWPPTELAALLAGLALIYIAVSTNVLLTHHESNERQRFMRGFKKMFSFESNLEQREEGIL